MVAGTKETVTGYARVPLVFRLSQPRASTARASLRDRRVKRGVSISPFFVSLSPSLPSSPGGRARPDEKRGVEILGR